MSSAATQGRDDRPHETPDLATPAPPTEPAHDPRDAQRWLRSPMARLVFASATALFLELACIRWAGGHVLYLSYVSNLLLLSCFLGLGLGCLASALRPARVDQGVTLALPLLLLFALAASFGGVHVVVDGPQAVYFMNERSGVALPAWLVLPTLGLLTTALFTALGTAVGRELPRRPSLVSYSYDIAGALAGVATFTLLSFISAPAALWFTLAGLCVVPLLPRRAFATVAGFLCVIATAAVVHRADAGSAWSPYYRVRVHQAPFETARADQDPTTGAPAYRLQVNSVTHQHVRDIRRREPFYEFAYHALGLSPVGYDASDYLVDPHTHPAPDGTGARPWGGRVLIIGAGTGTDVAFALAYGASHVDAVEIDPMLASIGRAVHPSRPYQDPRVTVHIDDGRAFLERARGPYDLVVFALPDSLTLASPYAGLRLESFLLTADSFARARALVKPQTGLFVLYNYYRERWLVQRTAAAIARSFGDDVRTLVGNDRNLAAVFLAGPALGTAPMLVGTEWGFRFMRPTRGAPLVPTDDWPFPYLRRREIPAHLLVSMGVTLTVAFALVAAVFFALRDRSKPAPSLGSVGPYFFMGAAFLLLETAGLVRMARLFGTTWLVNAMVFFAVLSMVLVGNALAPRLRGTAPRWLYVALLVALAGAWIASPSLLAGLAPSLRYGIASVALFLPILLGNLAFSASFRETRDPGLSLGANLLGAVLGGLLENTSLALGYRALLGIAAGLYLLALWTGSRKGPTTARTTQPAGD